MLITNAANDNDDADKKPKKKSGQNKSRKATAYRVPKEANLCKAYMNGPQPVARCAYEKCKYMHDVQAYLSAKTADIAGTCYIYTTRGFCARGVTCRFAGAHLDAELKNLTNAEIYVEGSREADTLNSITNSK